MRVTLIKGKHNIKSNCIGNGNGTELNFHDISFHVFYGPKLNFSNTESGQIVTTVVGKRLQQVNSVGEKSRRSFFNGNAVHREWENTITSQKIKLQTAKA